MATKLKFAFPKTIGACADRLYALKQQRLAESKGLDQMKAEETALKEHIIDTLPRSESTGAAGKVARVTIVLKMRAEVQDFEALVKWALKNKRLDLLTRGINNTVATELWDEGKTVPGLEAVQYKTISLNKV